MIVLSLMNAWALNRTVCVDIAIDFTDTGGDFWANNDPVPARGVRFEMRQKVNGVETVVGSGNLGAAGCATRDINFGAYEVRVYSDARWKNVDLISKYQANGPLCHPSGTVESAVWTVPGGVNPSSQVVGASDRWRNLALATWAIHRNKHGLYTGTNRACCTSGAPTYQADGTCSSGVSDYQPQSGAIYLYADPGSSSFGDNVPGCGTQPGIRGLRITTGTKIRTLIAHEFGHLITSMRMGGADQWSLTAGLDGCMGDYKTFNPFNPNSPSDSPVAGGRGEFSKEYLAAAIREGYADFYATWLFNRRTEPNSVFDLWTFHDIDLDCDLDDYFGPSDTRNGRVSLNGGLEVEVVDTGDPTLFTDGDNWLRDLESESDSRQALGDYTCTTLPQSGFTRQCVDHVNDHNRATMIDLARFFWQLNQTSNGSLAPKKVTDLYIDTCPRAWDDLNPAFWHDDHPYQRLLDSAAWNQILGPVQVYDDLFLP